MSLVHVSCLNDWRSASCNDRSYYRCDACHFEYRLQRLWIADVLISPGFHLALTISLFAVSALVVGILGQLLTPWVVEWSLDHLHLAPNLRFLFSENSPVNQGNPACWQQGYTFQVCCSKGRPGCGPETATDYDATTTAFIFAIVILVLGFCCCCGMTVFFVLPKVCEKKRNIFSVETWCAMGSDREGACPGWCALVGCPCFLAIWPWLAWGMYTSGRNRETLQAMQPDLCEEWLTPAPVGFTQNLCCVASNTGTTSLARCESFSCESSGLAWVMPYPNGDSVEECCVATTAAPNVATTLTSTMTTSWDDLYDFDTCCLGVSKTLQSFKSVFGPLLRVLCCGWLGLSVVGFCLYLQRQLREAWGNAGGSWQMVMLVAYLSSFGHVPWPFALWCHITGAMVQVEIGTLTLASLKAVGSIAVMAAGGFWMTRLGIITNDVRKGLGELSMNLLLPCLMFSQVIYCNSKERGQDVYVADMGEGVRAKVR
eukprot:symbB.v1.2.011105.t1/scaffold729.1/size168447/8